MAVLTNNHQTSPKPDSRKPDSGSLGTISVWLNPSTVRPNPSTARLNPSTVRLNPSTVRLNPSSDFRNPGLDFANPTLFVREMTKSRVFALFALILMLFGFSAQAQTVSAEYKLKAVYLLNFLQYVDFPKNVFADEKSPIVIGVLGSDPFGKALDDTVSGETVRGRPVEVRRYTQVKEVKGCQLLFISASESKRLNSILATLYKRSILTVSDADDFAIRGGMIKFVTENNKIRFRINRDAAQAADISISAKLLQLAEIVSTEKRP